MPMSGQTWGTRGLVGMEHPDDSTLLAYIRRQLAESESGAIYQHVSNCPQCAERWKEYGQISSLLSKTLKSGYWNQSPGTLSERVFEQIEYPEEAHLARLQQQREQSRRDAIRCWVLIIQPFAVLYRFLSRKSNQPRKRAMAPVPIFSIPAIAFLIMLVSIAALAYSFRGPIPFTNHSSVAHFMSVTPPANANIKGHRILPLKNGASPNNSGTNATTPTPRTITGGAKPTITVCTLGIDRMFSRIRICGSQFPAGDRVQLIEVIGGSQSRLGRPVLVNKQGDFQEAWTILNCKQLPTAIYAYDVSSGSQLDSETLQNIEFGKCFVPPPSKRGTGSNPPSGPPNPGIRRNHH
jgi:hypothetical protein